MSEDVSKDHLKKLLGELVDADQPWSALIKDKQIAQLGDSLANFIYSLALSLAKGKCTGTRVPDTVLTNAYHSSAVKTRLPVTGKKGRVGDAVEAVLLLSWLHRIIRLPRTRCTHRETERIGILFSRSANSLLERKR